MKSLIGRILISAVTFHKVLQFFILNFRLRYMGRSLNLFILLLFASGLSAQKDQFMVYDASTFSSLTKAVNDNTVDLEAIKGRNYTPTWQMPSQAALCPAPASRFSGMQASCGLINTEHYPASATVKIVAIHGDTTWDKCSGMMVGDRYVLTAAHCVISETDGWKDIKQFIPYLYVKPAYDKGRESKYGRAQVRKVYIYKSYFQGSSKKDIALLELSEPIGENTGWVNMDFETDNQKALATRYYNFSYPMDGERINYYRDFKGDTMYFKAGYPDLVSQHYIGISSPGIPGESGSLLIADDNNGYTAYGVRNFSEMKFSFYRLKREEVYAFYNIMNRNEAPKKSEEPLLVNNTNFKGISIYPNPVFEKAIITTNPSIEQIQVICFDSKGAEVYHSYIKGSNGKFVFENYNLPQGNYTLLAQHDNILLGITKLAIRK